MKYFFLALFVYCFTSINAQDKQKFIDINGTSEVILPADQIEFTVQIKIIDESVEASKKNNDKQLDKLLAALKSYGINSNDIEVSPLTLGKNYEYDINRDRKQKGFFTEIQISFVLKDLSKYYNLTNSLASSNYLEIISSNYSRSDYEQQHKSAYEKALNAAKEKAEYMTKALGVKLGEVLEIEENNYRQNFSLAANTITLENSAEGSISGKVTIRRSVRVKFAIN